jgi:hypothetical protein
MEIGGMIAANPFVLCIAMLANLVVIGAADIAELILASLACSS